MQSQSMNMMPHAPFADQEVQPVVLPQTSKSLQGVFFSPFSRAYPPSLSSLTPPITKEEFVRFVDDLNEAFIANPVFQALGLAGTVTSFAPSAIAHIVGSAVSWTAGLGSAATSYTRTRIFVKEANQRLFSPRGLELRISSTKDMLAAVGVDRAAFNLPLLPEFNEDWAENQEGSFDDPRVRWLKALEGHVAPLDWQVPPVSEQQNWLKKGGAWKAQHEEQRQNKKLREGRAKQQEEQVKESYKLKEKIDEEQAKMYKIRQKIIRLEAKEGSLKGGEKMYKLQKELRECEEKIEEEKAKCYDKSHEADRKERKIAQKVRWVVIVRASPTAAGESEVDTGIQSRA